MSKILIKNTMVITMENRDKIIKNGYILLKDGLISSMGTGEYSGDLQGVRIVDGSGCAALPGFINCHTHIPMTLLRGYGEGLPLMRWLNEKIWPFEAKLKGDDIEAGAALGMIEMIRSGTTAFVDMYYREDVIGDCANRLGIRACLGSPLIGDDWEKQMEETIKLNDRFKGSPLIKVMIAPHSPYTCSEESLKKAGETARKLGMPVHIHIAETMDELNIIRERYGASPMSFCEASGLFQDNLVIAAHCVHVSEADMLIMKKHGISPVYNPQSNMKLASGVSPAARMLEMGINVALGTDGASSNNNLSLIDEMQTASFLQKLSANNATVMGAYETLELATVNGAKAIGMEGVLGVLKEGFAADIVLMDISRPHMVPMFDVYSNIVFSSNSGDVKTVIINGNVVMEDFKISTADEAAIIQKASNTVEDILRR